MIIIKIKGGLGNQFFQYAYGRAISIKQNTDLTFDISKENIYEIKNDIAREYKLDKFKIVAKIAIATEIAAIKNTFSLIVKKIWRKLTSYNYDIFDESFLNIQNNTYLEGFWWQNEKYFLSIKDTIKNELILKNPLSDYGNMLKNKIEEMKKNNQVVLIHVRRGDYVSDLATQKHHGVLDVNYYKKALDLIVHKSPNVRLKYILVSDDIEWLKSNISPLLPSGQYEIISNPSSLPDYEEMMLMKMCDHFIIANSSFSWWAAWLGEKENSIIVAPSRWTSQSKFPNSPVPERWNIINT